MTSPPVRTSIHDLTSLRVHASSGRRARRSEAEAQHGPRRATVDRRGNVLAVDAAGIGQVARSKRGRRTGGKDGGIQSEGLERPKKRRKRRSQDAVETSLDFLANAKDDAIRDGEDDDTLPLPSSDLLKCIHHFASTFYADRGELYHAGNEARTERRERRRRRETYRAQRLVSDEPSGDAGGSDDESEEESENEEKGITRLGAAAHHEDKLRRTMYRSMDGSALMAISILLQEYVASLIDPEDGEGEWDQDADVQELDADVEDGDGEETLDDTVVGIDEEEEEEDEEEEEEGGDSAKGSRSDSDNMEDGSG